MKIASILALIFVGVAHAKLEADFERDVIAGAEDKDGRELWHNSCCEWVCDDDEPSYYYSKAGMKGGYYSRRTEAVEGDAAAERELPGKGWGGGWGGGWGWGGGSCYWDCDGCGYYGGGYGYGYGGMGGWKGGWGHGGFMCFPTYTDPDDCECTCCGYIPPPEEEEPSYYPSKAGMKGGKGRKGYYRRTEETGEMEQEQPEQRELPGKGWGGGGGWGWGGPGISCMCECDEPYYPSKAGMKGGKGRKGGYYDDYY